MYFIQSDDFRTNQVDFMDVLHYLYKWMDYLDDISRVRLYGIIRDLYRLKFGEDVPDFPGKYWLEEELKRLPPL